MFCLKQKHRRDNGSETKDSVENHNLVQRIKSRIQVGFDRRRIDFVKDIFSSLANNNKLSKEKFGKCLERLGIEHEDAETVFNELDKNQDEVIEFDEFKQALTRPTAVMQWTASLPLSELVADALPIANKSFPLQEISEMSESVIGLVCACLGEAFEKILLEGVRTLKRSFDERKKLEAQNPSAPKFQIISMSSGKSEDYHMGLEGRIGTPHLKFLEAMGSEHCVKVGSNLYFITTNYKVRTCPAVEWTIILRRKGMLEASFLAMVAKEFPQVGLGKDFHNRRIPDVIELLKIEAARLANLTEEEIFSIVLYTGPMFQIYNSILRRWPLDLYEQFARGQNLFTTTIFVLVSAVQKLSRTACIPDGTLLYRGLGGTMDLPVHFWKGDSLRRRGHAEWAFMSTTSNKDVALQYSGVREGKPLAQVLVIRTGAIDRGASLSDFSQYQGEKEFLWLPLSFLQPDGERSIEVTASGVVSSVPIRVIPNLKAATIEEALKRKKTMHIAAFRFLLAEIERDLEEIAREEGAQDRLEMDYTRKFQSSEDFKTERTVEMLLQSILEQAEGVLQLHEARAAEEYIDDNIFRGLVIEMLDTKTKALSKLRWWIKDHSQTIVMHLNISLLEGQRGWTRYLERSMAGLSGKEYEATALKLCKLRGLVREKVEEINEVGENALVRAAAEGSGAADLQILIAAGGEASKNSVPLAMMGAAKNNKFEGVFTFLRHPQGSTYQAKVGAFFLAASEGHEKIVLLLLRSNVDVKAVYKEGNTALHLAAQNGHEQTVQVLVEAKAEVNARGNLDRTLCGYTPLHLAVQGGWDAAVKLLISNGADVNALTKDKRNPLDIAARFGHFQTVKTLVESGADVLFNESGQTALHHAAENRNEEMVIFLIWNKADVNAKNSAGGTPLCSAAKAGSVKIIQRLVEFGAKIEISMDSLQIASALGHAEAVRALLELKADANADYSSKRPENFVPMNLDNGSPLYVASAFGHVRVVELLLEHQADVNYLDPMHLTALHRASKNGHHEVITKLVVAKADLNARDMNGISPLQIARMNQREDTVEFLLENKADPSIDSSDPQAALGAEYSEIFAKVHQLSTQLLRRSPLHIASAQNDYEAVKRLVDGKADINALDATSMTPLMSAIETDGTKAVLALLDGKADANVCQNDGTSALFMAAKKGMETVVNLLLKAKADPNVSNSGLETPLSVALERGHFGCAESLQHAGARKATEGPGTIDAIGGDEKADD